LNPSQPLSFGGFVRLIHPLYAARLLTLLLAFGVAAPIAVAEAAAQQTKKTTARKTVRKPAYNASTSQARKARLSRARAAARAREQARVRALQEAMTPRYKTDASGALVPDIRAAAAIIFDPDTGQVLWEENAQDKRSIASITKVMTALVFLEDDPDLSREITIERSDVYAASTTYLRVNDRISLDHVLHLTLIASDNAAARALARNSHGGTAAFIERMNEKAVELGLESTTFADPSGLNPANISSAYDLSRLITIASGSDTLAPIMRTASFTARTNRRTIAIRNTNHLVRGGEVDVLGGKTGFISKAGYCLATLLRLPQSNHQVAVVVLGAGSNNGRFWETRHLFNWLSDKAGDAFGKEENQD
jgi:D-alanyl-D-alanine endopeptidase (penicillin-binding protein 7)